MPNKKHDHVCDRDGCTNVVTQVPGPGRPRRFCSDDCRWAHHTEQRQAAVQRQMQLLRALAAQAQAVPED